MINEQLKVYEKEGNDLIVRVKSIQITDQKSREYVVNLKFIVRDKIKEIVEFFKPMKNKAKETLKAISSQESFYTNKYLEILQIINDEIKRDHFERERIKKELEQKELIKAEEKERKEKEKLENKALDYLEKGNEKKAEELLEKAENVFVPANISIGDIKRTSTDLGKITIINDIEVEIIDEIEILKHIINGKLPIACVDFKLGKIKRHISDYGLKELSGLKISKTIRSMDFRGDKKR